MQYASETKLLEKQFYTIGERAPTGPFLLRKGNAFTKQDSGQGPKRDATVESTTMSDTRHKHTLAHLYTTTSCATRDARETHLAP